MGKLIKFEKDYADEFDVVGYRVMTNTELKQYLLAAEKASYPKEMYFGTNEAVEFHSFDDFVNSLEIVDMSAEAAQVISDKVGDDFGWFPEFKGY